MINPELTRYQRTPLRCGGMSIVEKVTNLDYGETWVEKRVIKDHHRPYLKQEFRSLLALFGTPEVIKTLGIDPQENFICLEYFDGKELRKITKPQFIFRGINGALRALQKQRTVGIVHRDLKPDNILINDSGEVKVIDYGLAKLKGTFDLLPAGEICGTAVYMSPEQARGEPVTWTSDLFSLAGTLYTSLTGEYLFVPFTEKNRNKAVTLAAAFTDPALLPAKKDKILARGYSSDLANAVVLALHPHPQARISEPLEEVTGRLSSFP